MRSMRCLPFVATLLVLPAAASAACEGRDWRDELAPETMRKVRARASQVPFHEGIAFEAARGETRLTLFGTVHVHDPGIFVPDEVAARIEAADLLLVEVTSDVGAAFERRLTEDPSRLFDLGGPSLRSRLATHEWDSLRGALSVLGMDPNQGERLRPWFAALLLESAPCDMAARSGGARVLDERVEGLARDAGVSVDGLDEDPEQLLSFFADLTEEEQLDLLRLSLAAYAADGSNVVTFVGIWNDEETALLWEIARVRTVASSGDAAAVDAWLDRIHRNLLEERNRDWVARIEEWSAKARNIVVAVGALHLPGEDGLLRLLERKGFAIRRLFVL